MHIASGFFPSITTSCSNLELFIVSAEVVAIAKENKKPHRGQHDLMKRTNLPLSKADVFILL